MNIIHSRLIGLTLNSYVKNEIYVLEKAICVRTYFCEKMGGSVRFKKGDKVSYTHFDGFIVIDGYLDISKTQFYKYFEDMNDWREKRINEIFN